MSQIDAALPPLVLRGLVRALTALSASEFGLDAEAAVKVSFKHYSEKNGFLQVANDARAVGLHVASTGFGVPVGELARILGTSKQIISRQVARAEDLRDSHRARLVIERIERLVDVAS